MDKNSCAILFFFSILQANVKRCTLLAFENLFVFDLEIFIVAIEKYKLKRGKLHLEPNFRVMINEFLQRPYFRIKIRLLAEWKFCDVFFLSDLNHIICQNPLRN